MTSSRAALQDSALSDLKLIFQTLDEIQNIENKAKRPIFENSLRFTFQELAKTIQNLNQISPDALLLEKSSFLSAQAHAFDVKDLLPQALTLQKYLLATLL